jgi:hypothetical protein
VREGRRTKEKKANTVSSSSPIRSLLLFYVPLYFRSLHALLPPKRSKRARQIREKVRKRELCSSVALRKVQQRPRTHNNGRTAPHHREERQGVVYQSAIVIGAVSVSCSYSTSTRGPSARRKPSVHSRDKGEGRELDALFRGFFAGGATFFGAFRLPAEGAGSSASSSSSSEPSSSSESSSSPNSPSEPNCMREEV